MHSWNSQFCREKLTSFRETNTSSHPIKDIEGLRPLRTLRVSVHSGPLMANHIQLANEISKNCSSLDHLSCKNNGLFYPAKKAICF
jgi:hypothetical protein